MQNNEQQVCAFLGDAASSKYRLSLLILYLYRLLAVRAYICNSPLVYFIYILSKYINTVPGPSVIPAASIYSQSIFVLYYAMFEVLLYNSKNISKKPFFTSITYEMNVWVIKTESGDTNWVRAWSISDTPLGFECSGAKRTLYAHGKPHLCNVCTTIWIFECILLLEVLKHF